MAAQIIVVDDDPIVGTLTFELLQDAGYSALLIQDSLKAEEAIKREKPALVILDILMPGIDGLTLLHRLKSDPATRNTRSIIVSGKSFAAEKERALKYGADLFIEKPYDVAVLSQQIAELLKDQGIAPAPPAPDAAPSAPSAAVSAFVWASRPPCVSLELPKALFIFDAGKGLIPLGEDLARSGRFKELFLFLTHFHAGHVEGLPQFACARDASFVLNIAGASDADKKFAASLAEAFAPGFGGGTPPCRLELYELMEHTYEILPGVHLTAFYANHPSTTLGFVLNAENRKIVYCPDSELYGEFGTALQDYDEKLGGLCRGADLLFHNGRYTEEDYKANRNLGHSSFLAAVDFAARNEVKQLVLVHQDDRYGDDVLDAMAKTAEARVAEKGYRLKVFVGRDGLKLDV